MPSTAQTASTTPEKPVSLDKTLALAGYELSQVNELILERVSAEIPLIRDIASHIIASGGKRLRPLLTLVSARMFGYSGTRHVCMAGAVEFIHTATLLHDDVVDESDLRRGNPTANAMFGNQGSVLVGDFLLAQAFRLMVEDGSLEVLDILSSAAAIISSGEVKQLMTAGNPDTTLEQYMDVITCKTAELFAAACEIGPVIAGRGEFRTALRQYGNAVGIAFQLVDDALDYCANQQVLGKTVGDDFREAKVTLPVILACQQGDEAEKAFWKRTLDEQQQDEGDFAEARRLIEKHGAIAATFDQAKSHCEQALAAIQPLPECPEKEALREIVDFCAGRMY